MPEPTNGEKGKGLTFFGPIKPQIALIAAILALIAGASRLG